MNWLAPAGTAQINAVNAPSRRRAEELILTGEVHPSAAVPCQEACAGLPLNFKPPELYLAGVGAGVRRWHTASHAPVKTSSHIFHGPRRAIHPARLRTAR